MSVLTVKFELTRVNTNFIKREFDSFYQLEFVADSVIEATARLEFEDGLRTGVLHGGCWCP